MASNPEPDDYGAMPVAEDQAPFVDVRSDFSKLQAFYAAGDGNEVWLRKLEEIKAQFAEMRCIRGDGNCFYRAMMFAIFEIAVSNSEYAKEFRKLLSDFFDAMTKEGGLGYQADAVEMFYDDTIKPLEETIEGKMTESALREAFCEYATSNAIVFYARLVCSSYLQQQEENFAPFLAVDGLTVKDFVNREVEPLDTEVEHLQILALTQALKVKLRIVYLDRSEGPLNTHEVSEDQTPGRPVVTMLYRPGHYDLLYPK